MEPEAQPIAVPVFCALDEMASVESLKEHPRNPNKHPRRQVELLAKIIEAQGWQVPVTVSNRSGYVVRGHGRLRAAKLQPKLAVNHGPDGATSETD